jgi:agmatinase
MARVKEICPVVQVGVRSVAEEEAPSIQWENVFLAKDIYDHEDWIKKAVSQLKEKVYITIDMDVFETSLMPSTGTPEPGGLGWYQVLKFLKQVIEKKKILAFDVVELCPNKNNKSPDFLAAKLIYKLLSYLYNQ